MNALVTLKAPAASKTLVDLATVKAQLGIGDNSQDAELNRLIALAGQAVAGAHGLRRPPWRQTYDVRLASDGGRYLLPPVWPIESVGSVLFGVTDGTAVDPTTYSIEGEARDRLYAPMGWYRPGDSFYSPAGWYRGWNRPLMKEMQDELAYLLQSVVAGWLMPGQVVALPGNGASVAKGTWTKPSDVTSAASLFRFECTTAGARGSVEPTWPTTAGATVDDGGAVWTARQVGELPDEIYEAALLTVVAWYDHELEVPSGILSESHGRRIQVTYDDVALREGINPLPPAARLLLSGWIQL